VTFTMIEPRDGVQLHVGDALTVLKTMPDAMCHCCVTSPPYWGLRNYGVEGQLGLEPTPELYVEHLVGVLREVRRVLRPEGTLWLVLGDSYWGGKGQSSQAWSTAHTDRGVLQKPYHQIATTGETRPQDGKHPIIKPKDLVGIPWMVAFALRVDGWWLRSDIIWSKSNPMPESVTDRPTTSHEHIFLLSKSPRYYYDIEATKEPAKSSTIERARGGTWHNMEERPDIGFPGQANRNKAAINRDIRAMVLAGDAPRVNLRSVWRTATEPYRGAHFATYPTRLVEPCIKAGTSAKGCCPKCGAPWERAVERKAMVIARSGHAEEVGNRTYPSGTMLEANESKTIGWRPTCNCGAPAGLQADDLEIILSPTGERTEADPSLVTGRAGYNRPRGDNEGRQPMTRYEQRHYAEQLRDSPYRANMATMAGSAFEHYIRTDKAGARPIPHNLLSDWVSRGWLIVVNIPSWMPLEPVPCTVLDPFMGSGTTGYVARLLGRQFVGIELNPKYVELARERIGKAQAPLPGLT